MPRNDGRRRTTGVTRIHRQELVTNATFPEQLLWSKLRARQLGGIKFRRQHPIEPYIVDFYCATAKLAIELDGRSHDDTQLYDQDRETIIRREGVRVLRIANDDILQNLDGVLELIANSAGIPDES
ncbi:MAG: endonuclease domain-containing protein [Planctomycetota bacterium]